MVTSYNVVSHDGYIARKNGDEDFIPDLLWKHTLNFFKQFDVIIMGRKTYETIRSYPSELLKPFEELSLEKIVVTKNRKFQLRNGYRIANTPEDALTDSFGKKVLVSSGPTLNTYLLEHGKLDRVVFDILEENIGDGIKPFTTDTNEYLQFSSEKKISGVREMTYSVSHLKK
jgi:dihydrofolate reductase